MNFKSVRRVMFQFHMWIGLALGILLALLGLSGSVLVYDDALVAMTNPVPHASAQGAAMPLDRIVQIARDAADMPRGQAAVTPPQEPGDATQVRFGQLARGGGDAPRPDGARRQGEGRGAGRGEGGAPQKAVDVFVDPVSGAVLTNRPASQPAWLGFAHQLHGNFLMGQQGRIFVGYLGVAMLILGVTGLVLWWPKRGQWKYAFIVRRTARGLRLHRELHAMFGIWAFVVFMIVSFSGVVLAWPQLAGTAAPGQRGAVPSVEPVEGASRIGADQAAQIAQTAIPGATIRSITLPARRDQAITVSLLADGGVNAQVTIDPYRANVIAMRAPGKGFMAWQRPLHQGSFNGVWKFLVFLSGLLPALFVFTGLVMWVKKRRAHIAAGIPLSEEALP